MGEYTYFTLLLATIAYPLAQSFEWRLQLWKQWKYIFPAILLTATPFLVWDVFFARHGVWGFNPAYVAGIWMFSLPLEEWLFFILVPYACFFIFAVLNHFFPRIRDFRGLVYLHWGLTLALLVMTVLFRDRTYSVVAFSSAFLVMAAIGLSRSLRPVLPRFYLAYAVSLIPFLVINGFLTALPVVTYNDAENLGKRIFTIPVEDAVYLLTLLMMNFGLYARFSGYRGNDKRAGR